MTDLEKAARQALDALEYVDQPLNNETVDEWEQKTDAAITALRQALANAALDKMADNVKELGLDYEPVWGGGPTNRDYEDAMRAKDLLQLTAALEQPAQEVDWEKLYRLEVKKKEALAAKYERDTGKQLTRIVPMNQPAQQEFVECRYGDNGYACCEGGPCAAEEHNDRLAAQQEPVAWATRMGEYAHIHWGAERPEYPMVYEVPLYTRPQAREPLTDDEIHDIYDEVARREPYNMAVTRRNIARAIEAKLREKNA